MLPQARADLAGFIATYDDIVNRIATLSGSYIPNWPDKPGNMPADWLQDWARFRGAYVGAIGALAKDILSDTTTTATVPAKLNDDYFKVFVALRAINTVQSPETRGSLSNLYARLLASDPKRGNPRLFEDVSLPQSVDPQDLNVLKAINPSSFEGVLLKQDPQEKYHDPVAYASHHKLLFAGLGGLVLAGGMAYMSKRKY